ncbi:MAG: AMP-binding protein [Miltoncostaeaceae bacterium]
MTGPKVPPGATHMTRLTPLAFLERAADVFADHAAIVHEGRVVTYREFAGEVIRLANALRASGIAPGDRVAYLCPNTPELVVAHFAVPLAGGVLVALNTRLVPPEIAAILDHSGARLLLVDAELAASVAPIRDARTDLEEVVVVPAGQRRDAEGATPLDDLMARGSADPLPWTVGDEDGLISLNYTSGTTGPPKGVMYTHRGAYLNALGENVTAGHDHRTVYLWTLPMFHCNGWCHPWAIVAAGGTQVTARAFRPSEAWRLIREHGVSHLCGAPPVLAGLVDAPEAEALAQPLHIMTAAAPPNPTVLARLEALGARITHVYGLTETYGPHTVCQPQVSWDGVAAEERSVLLKRQGVAMVMTDPIRVVDGRDRDVPRDGRALGEVVMRGNNVMKGYFADPEGTAEAFRGGWFHSGDVAVWHPDGYIELRDRAKDIVISGGENISTIEVEQAITAHPGVVEAAVVGVPDERWGERPWAFVVPRERGDLDTDALRAHVRGQLAGYKCPDVFEPVDDLPRTSTGKVQKYVLRERAAGAAAARRDSGS